MKEPEREREVTTCSKALISEITMVFLRFLISMSFSVKSGLIDSRPYFQFFDYAYIYNVTDSATYASISL